MALVCGIVALPVGIVVGRVVWQLSSRNLPIQHVTSVPFAALGIAAVGVGLLAVAVSALVAIGPARTNFAEALRAE